MKQLVLVLVMVLVVNGTVVLAFPSHPHETLHADVLLQTTCVNESEVIDDCTWSVLRYDHVSESDNFGLVSMPKPTPGPVIIPGNMMDQTVCEIAVSVYRETNSETLAALEAFDLDYMVVGLPLILWRMWAGEHGLPGLGQKVSAQEMEVVGRRWVGARLVGDCYSQSLVNTAVLRLCGFAAEEVFTVAVPMHAFVVVQLGEEWVVFDTVKGQFSGSAIDRSYNPPADDVIYWMENDKYFINFGTPYPEAWPYQSDPYSNIDAEVLRHMLAQVVPLLNHSQLGGAAWDVESFIAQATVCPDMVSVGMPYTVGDAVGSTVEEQAASLVALNTAFIVNHTGGAVLTQYDRCLYGRGVLSVAYPQAYANAARFGVWTSWCAHFLDDDSFIQDYWKTVLWIRCMIKNQQTLAEGCVGVSDFTCVCLRGSSVDQALLAYGMMRNMRTQGGFWAPEDLCVLVTTDTQGYLAVNTSSGWRYLNFGRGPVLSTSPPIDIAVAFNEHTCRYAWVES